MKPSRRCGGLGGSGGSRSHCAMKWAVKGPTDRSSVRLRPDSWTAAASSAHMSAVRDARRSARCLRPSLRSDSSARSSAISRLLSVVTKEKLVGVKKRHVRGGIVEPVGVVREFHRDTHVAALAWGTAVDFYEHLAARGRTNVNQ